MNTNFDVVDALISNMGLSSNVDINEHDNDLTLEDKALLTSAETLTAITNERKEEMDHISDSEDDELEDNKPNALHDLLGLLKDSDDEDHSSLPQDILQGLSKQPDEKVSEQEGKGKRKRRTKRGKKKDLMDTDEEDTLDEGEIEDDDEYAPAQEDEEEEKNLTKKSDSKRNSSGNGEEVISEDELIYCTVCRRSNLQVNFKKNYTINTSNYTTYCNTFPSTQIQKPKEGESLCVCSTCYNKSWRYARGQYDPKKPRNQNKREGLKKPPKLKTGEITKQGTVASPEGSGVNSDSSLPNKRRIKRKVDNDFEMQDLPHIAQRNAPKETTIASPIPTVDTATSPPSKKKVKRATKASKKEKVPPSPSTSSNNVATTPTVNTPVTRAAAKRGRKKKDVGSPTTPSNNNSTSGSSTTSVVNNNSLITNGTINATKLKLAKEEISLIILYYKVQLSSTSSTPITTKINVDGTNAEEPLLYSTKIIIKQPMLFKAIKELIGERLHQKMGDSFAIDCMKVNTIDRFKNVVKVDIDDFYFTDMKLNDNDSVCVYIRNNQ
ncbi:hypothetical protein ABK040_004102 [Willaertia magna]